MLNIRRLRSLLGPPVGLMYGRVTEDVTEGSPE